MPTLSACPIEERLDGESTPSSPVREREREERERKRERERERVRKMERKRERRRERRRICISIVHNCYFYF